MNLNELSSEFEVLFEDLASNGSKGLDEYEKSLCYTYAQEQIVRALVEQDQLQNITSLVKIHTESTGTQSKYKTGADYPIVQNPVAILGYFASSSIKDIPASVVPQTVIDSMLTAPYQYPPKDLVYVVVGEDTNTVFLPFTFTAQSFNTRYVDTPTPIILKALVGGDSINGLQATTEPVLDDSFKDRLVLAAVQYAIKIYIGQQEKEVQGGNSGN